MPRALQPPICLLVTALAATAPRAQERPRWDQEAARAKVLAMLEVERDGAPWDRIAWLHDPDEAAKRAAEQQKPLFVFAFLQTDSGPAHAPC